MGSTKRRRDLLFFNSGRGSLEREFSIWKEGKGNAESKCSTRGWCVLWSDWLIDSVIMFAYDTGNRQLRYHNFRVTWRLYSWEFRKRKKTSWATKQDYVLRDDVRLECSSRHKSGVWGGNYGIRWNGGPSSMAENYERTWEWRICIKKVGFNWKDVIQQWVCYIVDVEQVLKTSPIRPLYNGKTWRIFDTTNRGSLVKRRFR